MSSRLFASLVLVVSNAVADCQPETPELKSMDIEELVLNGPENRSITMAVRVADNYRERGAGFQHICPPTIDSTAIYFIFERPRQPSFHMENVKAPLDIAFIDDGGLIVDIQRMEPYVLGSKQRPRYGPPGPITAALETRAGFFKEQRITPGDWRIEGRKQ